MKIRVLLLLVASCLFQNDATANELPYGIESESVLAENDFSNNNLSSAPWSIRFGQWFIQDGELLSKEIADQHHSPSMSLFFDLPETHLFSFNFKIHGSGGMRVSLFGKGGLKFLIRRNKLSFVVSHKADKENYPFTVDVKDVTLQAERTHHIDLILSGHRVVAVLDGDRILAAEDPRINDHGKRYQFTMSPGCAFDNFKLSQIKLNEEAFSKAHFKSGNVPKDK